MKTELLENETLLRKGSANQQRGMETVGGKLYLTNRRLIFESHGLNFKKGPAILDLEAITNIEPGYTKFLGFIPLFPNALLIKTNQGSELRITLSGRDDWQKAIEKTAKENK